MHASSIKFPIKFFFLQLNLFKRHQETSHINLICLNDTVQKYTSNNKIRKQKIAKEWNVQNACCNLIQYNTAFILTSLTYLLLKDGTTKHKTHRWNSSSKYFYDINTLIGIFWMHVKDDNDALFGEVTNLATWMDTNSTKRETIKDKKTCINWIICETLFLYNLHACIYAFMHSR